jgi:hypothetical protein
MAQELGLKQRVKFDLKDEWLMKAYVVLKIIHTKP